MKNIKEIAEQIAVIYPYWIFTKYLLYIKMKYFLHAFDKIDRGSS